MYDSPSLNFDRSTRPPCFSNPGTAAGEVLKTRHGALPAVMAAPMTSSLDLPAGISCALIFSLGWSAFHASTICLPQLISASLFEYQIVMSPWLSTPWPALPPPPAQALRVRAPAATAARVSMRRRIVVLLVLGGSAALIVRRGSGGVAHGEGRCGEVEAHRLRAADGVEERARRDLAPGTGVGRDARECRVQVSAEFGVVEACDRQVARHRDAAPLCDPEAGDGHVVVRVDDGGGRIGAREDRLRGRRALGRAEVGLDAASVDT